MEFSEAARLMIVSDLDNTMVDHKDNHYTSLLRFGALWQADYNQDSLLVYSTGRSPAMYEELRSEVPLLTPGITIMSVGTEVRYGETMTPDLRWEEELNQGWNREVIVEEGTKLNLKFQVDSEQRPHKVSFYVDKGAAEEVIKTLTERIKEREVNVKLIYSGGINLDVLPTGAGKGQALAYLMKKLKEEGCTPVKTLVCGDSGNDAELFTVPDVYGVIVPDASYVHAYGITTNPLEEIETLRELHGVKKGKHFCIWVDRVRIEKLSDSLYLARFDKWEKSGPRFSCAITTALLQSKIDAVNGLQWKLIHETWLIGREGTKLSPPSQVPISEATVPEPPSPEAPTPEPPTPRAPMSESLQIVVPDSSVKIVVPESLSIVMPESLKIVAPESLKIVVPE